MKKSLLKILAETLIITALVVFAQGTAVTVSAAKVPHYNLAEHGGTWDGTHYTLSDGTLVQNAFFCDGTYTYYLQYDGTPMKDRLTYHPDGVHVIYFDKDGHEVFSDFANITTSISGTPVDDMCFFDIHGYMYVDTLTYDKTGTILYYVNPYGVLERNGWFTFSGYEFCAGLGFAGKSGGYGYANADCSLLANVDMFDWNGNPVHMLGDGHMEGSQTSGNCNLSPDDTYYKYEYAYRNNDLSGLDEGDMPFFNGLKEYLDYALQFRTPYLQEKAVYDYMANNCEYDYDAYYDTSTNIINLDPCEPQGVFVNRKAVCSGYASAFDLLMDILGIECEYIEGTANDNREDHAWNRVKLDGDWYMVDATWANSPDPYFNYTEYGYFNMPAKFFPDHYDYNATAEGTKYMGYEDNVLYYANADTLASQLREILNMEIKLVNRLRKFYIIVTETGDNDSSSDIYQIFRQEELSELYCYEILPAVDGSNDYFVRISSRYDSYEDYMADIGDAFYTVSKDTAEEEIAEILKEDCRNFSAGRRLCFYIQGENLTSEFCSELTQALESKNTFCSAYWYRYSIFHDKVRIEVSGKTIMYFDFTNYDKEIYDVSLDDWYEIMKQIIPDIGLTFSGDDKYIFAVSIQDDESADNLVSEIYRSFIHPYKYVLWSISARANKEDITIEIQPKYNSYDEYLSAAVVNENRQIRIIDEAQAYEHITNLMDELAAETDIKRYSNLYIKTSHKWESEELSRFISSLLDLGGYLTKPYNIYGEICDDNWVSLSINRINSGPIARSSACGTAKASYALTE